MDIALLIVGIVVLAIAVGSGTWQTWFNQRVEQPLLGSGSTLLRANWSLWILRG